MTMANTTTKSDTISCPGGKGNLYQKIINLIPPHRVYIEPFAGGGAIMRNKRPAPVNIAVDIDAPALEALRFSLDIPAGEGPQYRFVNADALAFLKEYTFTGEEFIYLDPPYLLESRRQSRQLYRCELSLETHAEILAVITGLACPVAISGYWSGLYTEKLAGWRSVSWRVRTRGGSWATEYLWMNYTRPVALHDYAHLGDNYRERERIKRKKTRWATRWAAMPILERQAILAAIQEAG